MEVIKPNLDGTTECNTIKGVIREAVAHDMDVACCYFNKCYEGNIEAQGMEFSSCEFRECISPNSKFERVHFTDVLFENCDFSNTVFYECNFVRVTFVNCKLVGSNFVNVNMYNILMDNSNISYFRPLLGTKEITAQAEVVKCGKTMMFAEVRIFNDQNVEACYTDPEANKHQIPCTLEGCVMRISDIIAYLGKDRQDAMKIGLIPSENLFSSDSIGSSNAEIINNMTVNIIESVSINSPIGVAMCAVSEPQPVWVEVEGNYNEITWTTSGDGTFEDSLSRSCRWRS